MLKPMSNPTPVPALVTGLNDTVSIWWRSSQKRASRMVSPNETPGFFSTCTMKGESAVVALLSYALRREQQALSWCPVSGRKHQYCTVPYNFPDYQGFSRDSRVSRPSGGIFRASLLYLALEMGLLWSNRPPASWAAVQRGRRNGIPI